MWNTKNINEEDKRFSHNLKYATGHLFRLGLNWLKSYNHELHK